MSRRKGGAPFSLFAFQDAITSVCGVVVLITLLLALELTRRVTGDDAPIENDARNVQESRDEIASLQNEIATLVEESRADAVAFEAASTQLSRPEARDALQDARKRLADAQKENERLRNARSIQDEIATLEKDVEKLNQEQKDAEEAVANAQNDAEKAKTNAAQANTSEFYVFPKNGRETPWFVELARDRLTVVGAEQRQDFSDVESFVDWAKKRSRREEYFVLIARPGGVENFERVFDKLQTMDFRMGVDLIGENKRLNFLTK